MSGRANPEPEVEQEVLELVMKLVRIFRAERKIEYKGIGKLFYKDLDYPELQDERKYVWQVIDIIHSKNPQISHHTIFSLLISEVVGITVFNPHTPLTDEELSKMARQRINKLFCFSSNREIDIPIVNLEVDGPPVDIGKVTFRNLLVSDREDEWWKKIKLNYSGNPDFEVLSYCRVVSPGDRDIALSYAEKNVRDTLLILRGISFPFYFHNVNQFGIINDYPVWPNKPFRLGKPEETAKIELSSSVVTQLGPQIMIYKIYSDFLNTVDKSVIEAINQLLQKESSSGLNEMQRKFLSGVKWIGEATKPDTLPSRYIKLSIALEFLVGGKYNKGITTTLAKRSACLLGNNQIRKQDIDNRVRRFYKLRSDIVHGRDYTVNQEDFVEFGKLIRKITIKVCQILPNIHNVDDFQLWILQHN